MERFFLIVLGIVLISCQEPKKIQLVSMSEPPVEQHSLSYFADDVAYIKLSNDVIFGHIVDFCYSPDRIIAYTYPEGVLMYDAQGNFLRRIGTVGKGPGEYVRASGLTVDFQRQQVFVLSSEREVLIYGFDGTFQSSFTLDFNTSFNKISILPDKTILLNTANYGQNEYSWIVVDQTGKLIQMKRNTNKYVMPVSLALAIITLSEHDQSIFYTETFNDTLFEFRSNTEIPYLVFARDKYRLQLDDFLAEAPEWLSNIQSRKRNRPYIHIHSLFVTQSNIWIGYALHRYAQLYIYDRQTGQGYELQSSKAEEGVVANDLDGGKPFYPTASYSNKKGEYMIEIFDAIDLKSHVASEAFKAATPKYPEKKLQLEQLANSLSENDNPVLMIVKLKE